MSFWMFSAEDKQKGVGNCFCHPNGQSGSWLRQISWVPAEATGSCQCPFY